MNGEPIPKHILKRINQKRIEQNLSPYEEDEKKKKKNEVKTPIYDVVFLYYKNI